MLKQHAILEIEMNDRIYQLHLPPESPLGEVFDVLSKMRMFVVNKIQEVSALDKTKTEEKSEDENLKQSE